jgi:hypothetical protein
MPSECFQVIQLLPPRLSKISRDVQQLCGTSQGKDEGGRMKAEKEPAVLALIHPSSFRLHPCLERGKPPFPTCEYFGVLFPPSWLAASR